MSIDCRALVYDAASDTVCFAAKEWQRYAAQVSGRTVKEAGMNPLPRGALILSAYGDELFPALPDPVKQAAEEVRLDGFAAGVFEQNIYVVGREPRGVLYGVYDLLEHDLGLVFAGPHEGEEYVPRDNALQICRPLVAQSPAMELRILGFHAYTGRTIADYPFDWKRMIDWMAKRKFNGIQTGIQPYLDKRDDVLPALRQRGFLIELGKHAIPELMPPSEVYDEHPDFFAKAPDGTPRLSNLCFSNMAMRQFLLERLKKRVGSLPEVDIWDLWPTDGPPFCECKVCRRRPPGEWILETTTDIAATLMDEAPGVRFTHLAYDYFTRAPEHVQSLPSNMIVQYCDYWDRIQNKPVYDYRQGRAALKTPEQTELLRTQNRPPRDHRQVCEELDGWLEITPHTALFSYYTDLVIKRAMTHVVGAIRRDMTYFAHAGVQGFMDCLTLPQLWINQALNAFALGDLSWDPTQSESAVVRRFVKGMFGADAVHAGVRYYQALATLLNQPCMLGFNPLDLVHRDPMEVEHFAGLVERMIEPTRLAFNEQLAALRQSADAVASDAGASRQAVKEMDMATYQLDWTLRYKFEVYLAHGYKRREKPANALACVERAGKLLSTFRESSRFPEHRGWKRGKADWCAKEEKALAALRADLSKA